MLSTRERVKNRGNNNRQLSAGNVVPGGRKRKTAEKAGISADSFREMIPLLESGELFQKILASHVSAVLILDAETPPGIIECNPATERMFGYRREELIGSTTRLLHVDNATFRKFAKFLPLESDGIHFPETFEYKMKRKNGEVFATEHSIVRLLDNEGRHKGWVSVIRDFSGRKAADGRLQYQATLLDNVSDAVISTDVDFNIRSWNRAAEKIYGWKEEEVIGKPVAEITHLEYPYDRQDDVVNHFREAGYWQGEVIQKTKDNRSLNILSYVSMMKDESGTPTGAVAVNRDISERKTASERMRYHATLLDNVSDAVISTDVDFNIRSWNRTAEYIYGWKENEVLGKKLYEIIPAEHPGKQPEDVRRKLLESGYWSAELTQKRKDGKKIFVFTSLALIRDDTGNPVNVVGIHHDITEKRRDEEAIKESEEKYRSLIENADIGIIIIQDGRMVFFNSWLCDRLGYTEEEYLSMDFMSTIFPDDRAMVIERIEERLRGESADNPVEIRVLTKTGEVRWIETSSVRIQWNGKPALQAFILDITERKRIEDTLRESEDRSSKAFYSSPDLMAIINLEKGQYVEVNDSFCNVLGYKREELVGHSNAEFNLWVYPEEEESMGRILQEKGKIRHEEFHFHTRSGDIRTWLCSVDIITIGGERCMLAVATDITERKKAQEELRIERDFARSVLNTAQAIILILDTEGNIVDFNPYLEEISGYSLEELKGRKWFEVFLPEHDHARIKKLFKTAIADNQTRGNINPIVTRDGSLRDIEWYDKTLKDMDGNVVGLLVVGQDVTERKRSEERINHLNQTLHAIRNVNRLITREADPDSLIKGICDSLQEGQSYHNVWIALLDSSGKFTRCAGSGMGNRLNQIKRALSGGEIPHCVRKAIEQEYLVITPDPMNSCSDCFLSTMYEDHCGMAIRLSYEDSIYGVLCATVDADMITDKDEVTLFEEVATDIMFALREMELEELRRQAEEALADSEEQLRTVIENSPEHIMLLDLDCNIVEINRTVPDLSIEEVVGKSIYDFTPEEYHQVTLDCFEGVRKTGETGYYSTTYYSRDDSVQYFDVNVTPLYQAGKLSGFISSSSDVTERKQLEDERVRGAKLESISTLAGGIAHDFNNLLTGIMGNIGLAMRYITSDNDAYSRLDEAEKASIRAKDLTQQLLTFARGGQPIKKVVSIGRLITEAAEFALRGSNVKLELSLPGDLWMAEIDEGQIAQVIQNIVINANEAMPSGGVLKISAANKIFRRTGAIPLPKGDYVRVDIVDSGIGISENHLQRVFEPYFTTKRKGSGLGLATAYSIIKNHGGYLTVDSVQNKGTSFHIYMQATRTPRMKESMPVLQDYVSAGGRILVMDDDEIIRNMLDSMLRMAGYESELACEGSETLEKYKRYMESGRPFAAVIMDLTIPGGMGGKETVQKLLKIDPEAKVIVSSGYATDPIMSDYKKYGFAAVITKPYSVSQLEETLGGLLNSKK